jgi:two-component system, response regulator YesN
MYSFLMVDDEEIILRGFREKIDWTAEGFGFLDPCRNGAQAIEAIDTYRPDVVMTDVCMPFADGLQVAAYVADRYPETLVVVLSGYDEFEYAQAAMRNRVFDYVLKPITPNQLRELLRKIRDKLESDRKSRLDLSELQEQAAKSRELLRERFLNQLVTGSVSDAELDRGGTALGLQLARGACAVVTVDIDDQRALGSLPADVQPDLCLMALQKRIEELLPEQNRSYVFQTPARSIVILVHSDGAQGLELVLRRFPEQVRKAARGLTGLTVTVGIGGPRESAAEIHESYEESLTAVRCRLIQGGDTVIRYARPLDAPHPSPRELRVFSTRLAMALRSEPLEAAEQVVRSFIAALQAGNLDVRRVENEVRRFGLALVDTLDEMGMGSPADALDPDPFRALSRSQSLGDAQEIILASCRAAFERMHHRRHDFTERKAREARDLIEASYADPELGMDKACARLAISASYLARLLKRHEGKTFVELVTAHRIDKARELLRGTDWKQSRIAEAVGYPDPQYFSFIFKKSTGQSPSEFRSQP